jgi:hypothetical protein
MNIPLKQHFYGIKRRNPQKIKIVCGKPVETVEKCPGKLGGKLKNGQNYPISIVAYFRPASKLFHRCI